MLRPNLYTRPAGKSRAMAIPSKRDALPPVEELTAPQIVAVDKGTECHVTPPRVARQMCCYADIREGHKVLEPSGGTGNIALLMHDRGHAAKNITVIERHYALCDVMRQRCEEKQAEYSGMNYLDIEIIQDCFLEWAEQTEQTFDRVVMNPPFRAVKQHIRAAESLLIAGGVIIALVPITFKHDTAEAIEELPNDTFATAKVSTKIIRIEK